jgi:molybdopterin/thiamine biosynthesis adenylyltransferase
MHLVPDSILAILEKYDFVIDATDNFASKFLINDACTLTGTPFSHGGILEFDGQTMTVLPGRTPCYRCLFPEPPPTDLLAPCSRAGVFGVLPGIIGTIQAAEAIKYLTGIGELLTGRFLTCNTLRLSLREVTLQRSDCCPACGSSPTIVDLQLERYPSTPA